MFHHLLVHKSFINFRDSEQDANWSVLVLEVETSFLKRDETSAAFVHQETDFCSHIR